MFPQNFFRLCASAPVERLVEEYDAIIIGGGPSGLATAIRLKQLAGSKADDLKVCLVEKGGSIGSHTLSGAVIEPRSLKELIPDFEGQGAPLKTKAADDAFYYLTKNGQQGVPSFLIPPTLQNHGNYVASLGGLCKWLGEKAADMGVDVLTGFAAAEPVYGEKGHLEGVQLNDVGINKKGEVSDRFEPGMIFKGKQTIFAEGCRGSMTMKMEEKFKLRAPDNYQGYGIGIKEVWEIPKEKHKPGNILHTAGWPLTSDEHHNNTYGGSWLYHYTGEGGELLVSTGLVVGLNYKNPHTRPYMEMQKWKTHPFIRSHFEGATPVWYGARCLAKGGHHALPTLTFPGGVLVGDCAGFLNLAKIKGTHTAIKSGMLAAEAIYEDILSKKVDGGQDIEYGQEVKNYEKKYKSSWLYDELYQIRNCPAAFEKNFHFGMAYTGLTCMITRGMEPWNWKLDHPDHKATLPIADPTVKPIEYPKPDNKITFDLLTSHSRSGTSHNGDQPAHLKLKDPNVPVEKNLKIFGGPEGNYCPAKVYEFVERDGKKELVINAQNCLHCKACSIKDPTQNINWCVPEGGGGPEYSAQM